MIKMAVRANEAKSNRHSAAVAEQRIQNHKK